MRSTTVQIQVHLVHLEQVRQMLHSSDCVISASYPDSSSPLSSSRWTIPYLSIAKEFPDTLYDIQIRSRSGTIWPLVQEAQALITSHSNPGI